MIRWINNLVDRWRDHCAKRAHQSGIIRVGDVAPESLLNHKAGDGNLGAMISVDPQTNSITAIFIP